MRLFTEAPASRGLFPCRFLSRRKHERPPPPHDRSRTTSIAFALSFLRRYTSVWSIRAWPISSLSAMTWQGSRRRTEPRTQREGMTVRLDTCARGDRLDGLPDHFVRPLDTLDRAGTPVGDQVLVSDFQMPRPVCPEDLRVLVRQRLRDDLRPLLDKSDRSVLEVDVTPATVLAHDAAPPGRSRS